MNKYLKIFLWVALAGIIIGGASVYYVFNMPHRNLENEEPEFVLTATELFADFSADETAGFAKYGDKAVQVSGEIVEKTATETEITLVLNDAMEGISCSFDSAYVAENKASLDALSEGDQASIKGKCDGIDMIMGVVLTRCVLVSKED